MTKQIESTKDIYLAAAWMASGAKYEKVDKTDPRHQEFYFSSTNEEPTPDGSMVLVLKVVNMEEIKEQWVNAELMVNAVQFKEALQRMKSIIHSS